MTTRIYNSFCTEVSRKTRTNVQQPQPVRQYVKVYEKTPSFYQVPKLRNLNFCCYTLCFWGMLGTGCVKGVWEDQRGCQRLEGLRAWDPHKNPRSLLSSKAVKFEFFDAQCAFFGRGVHDVWRVFLWGVRFGRIIV